MARVTLTINGRTFDVKRSDSVYPMAFDCHGRTLGSVYKTASTAKRSAWRNWYNWACDNNLKDNHSIRRFGVDSGNCFQFTISGYYLQNGLIWGLHITANNNYAYLIGEYGKTEVDFVFR